MKHPRPALTHLRNVAATVAATVVDVAVVALVVIDADAASRAIEPVAATPEGGTARAGHPCRTAA